MTILERRRSERYRLDLVTAPPAEPVTLAEQKAHMRVDFDADDTLIEALIKTARQHLDGPDGWLGRALVQQTWDMRLDGFPLISSGGEIRIPLAPLISVDQITYRDPDGQTQTLASSVYQVVDGGSQRAFVTLEPNQAWPGTQDRHDAVTVRFTAGYAPSEDSPPATPPRLKPTNRRRRSKRKRKQPPLSRPRKPRLPRLRRRPTKLPPPRWPRSKPPRKPRRRRR